MIKVHSVAESHIGKVRSHNEDAIYGDDNAGLWFVADGMGGHACGEIASQLASDTLTEVIDSGELVDSIERAHHVILKQAQEVVVQQGMGTTLVAAKLQKHGFEVAWVGDSRLYYFEKELQQLTCDHTFVQDMVFREVLTIEEAQTHHQKNLINRSLGMSGRGFKVDSIQFRPKRAGTLFLCSDGVNDFINTATLNRIFQASIEISTIAKSINDAVMATAAADNFSFIIVKYEIDRLSQWRNRLKLC